MITVHSQFCWAVLTGRTSHILQGVVDDKEQWLLREETVAEKPASLQVFNTPAALANNAGVMFLTDLLSVHLICWSSLVLLHDIFNFLRSTYTFILCSSTYRSSTNLFELYFPVASAVRFEWFWEHCRFVSRVYKPSYCLGICLWCKHKTWREYPRNSSSAFQIRIYINIRSTEIGRTVSDSCSPASYIERLCGELTVWFCVGFW